MLVDTVINTVDPEGEVFHVTLAEEPKPEPMCDPLLLFSSVPFILAEIISPLVLFTT
ncbi:hypothetical protein D3C76_1620330 [compost metagenome]